MTFRDETAHLAHQLAHLAVTGASRDLDPDGLTTAMAARRETLQLLRRVLHDVTGINPHAAAAADTDRHSGNPRHGTLRPLTELEAHPVAGLVRALAACPAPHGDQSMSLTDRHLAPPDSGVGRAWTDIARHALLAAHEWDTRPPQPAPEQQWSAVADVAALAQAVTVLDHDLHAAARRHPATDPALAGALTGALTSGLRTAATQAAALAAAGDLPHWGEPGPDSTPTRVLIVRNPHDVTAAQDRLAAQITAAGDLDPRAVALVAIGQARLLATAAAALRDTDPDRAPRAARLARQLTGSAAGAHQLAALTPGDPRPVAQTREILQRLTTAGSRGWDHPATRAYLPALAAAVDCAPAVVHALARHAERAVRTGRWLVPNTDAEYAHDPLWRRTTPHDPEPKMCTALSATAAHATAQLPLATTGSSSRSGAPPREALAGVAALTRQPRPTRPAQRPSGDIGRG